MISSDARTIFRVLDPKLCIIKLGLASGFSYRLREGMSFGATGTTYCIFWRVLANSQRDMIMGYLLVIYPQSPVFSTENVFGGRFEELRLCSNQA